MVAAGVDTHETGRINFPVGAEGEASETIFLFVPRSYSLLRRDVSIELFSEDVYKHITQGEKFWSSRVAIMSMSGDIVSGTSLMRDF